jgi:MGT family glycosyltransferase
MTDDCEPRNFLLATWEGGGSVPPVLTVARKLLARGHRVRVMSDSCNRPEAEAVGAKFIPWTRAPSRTDRSRETDVFRDWEVATPQEQILRVIDRIMAGPALAYARDVIEELEREAADLVVSSEMLFGVMVGCEAVRQRFALLTCNVSLLPMQGVPPLGPGLLPPTNAEEVELHKQIASANLDMFNQGLPTVNAARAAFSLPPLTSVEEQHLAAERLLLGTSQAFDFAPAPLPNRTQYVGPQLDDPAWSAPWRSPWPAQDSRPLVLVSFSTTFQDHAGVLQTIIDSMATLPVRVLVTLGGAIAADELEPPANCHLVHSAPHNQVMEQACLVITHGGHGTVTRTLRFQKPLIVVPHGRDQNDNAARVTARGAGLRMEASAPAVAFTQAISEVLGNPTFGAAAKALGEMVAYEAEHSPVVRELEALADLPVGATSRRAA